jgi:hypothetical protein
MVTRISALLLTLLIAACTGVPIGPPDFSCHTAGREMVNSGSGCATGHGG